MAKHELLKKVPHSGKLSKWLREWLRDQPEPKDRLIEEAVIKQHKLKPPKV